MLDVPQAPLARVRGLATLLLALGALASPAAHADDPVSEEVVFAAGPDQVKAMLADPNVTMSLNQDVISYTVQDAPPCQLIHVTAKGVTEPFRYTMRRCPTANGFRETFVSGDGMVQAMDVEWRAEAHGDGTKVRLSVLARIAKVPQFLVNQHTRQSIAQSLRSLVRKTETQAR
ncbi:hypothetical protein L6R53_19960 [Myxococcota bacterium]|nr:hypothetical protein [Myxococcota bacterium]